MAGRGAYAKGVAKREEILSTALDVVEQLGYRGASVREIADAVGLSPPGLLHYFDSKEALFTAILRKRDEQDLQAYSAEGAGPEVLMAVVRHNATVPGLVQLYAELSAEVSHPTHPAREYFLERTQAFHTMFREVVVLEQAKGTLRADLDADWIVTTLHALADGLQTQWLLNPELDMAAQIKGYFDLISSPEQPSPADESPAEAPE